MGPDPTMEKRLCREYRHTRGSAGDEVGEQVVVTISLVGRHYRRSSMETKTLFSFSVRLLLYSLNGFYQSINLSIIDLRRNKSIINHAQIYCDEMR